MSGCPPEVAESSSPSAKSPLARRLVASGVVALSLATLCFIAQFVVISWAMDSLQPGAGEVNELKQLTSDMAVAADWAMEIGLFTTFFFLAGLGLSISGLLVHWFRSTS